MSNFDADVKKMTTRHQCENRVTIFVSGQVNVHFCRRRSLP